MALNRSCKCHCCEDKILESCFVCKGEGFITINEIPWLSNLTMFIVGLTSIKPKNSEEAVFTFQCIISCLSFFCRAINKFIDINLIKGDKEKEEVIQIFIDYCFLVGDFRELQFTQDERKQLNKDRSYFGEINLFLLSKTLKRCIGVLSHH